METISESVLIAELALLNNHLPARLCFPLWCECSSTHDMVHDQIVRIPVKEAAVLNSKEKVPYVVQVEVLRSTYFHLDHTRSEGNPTSAGSFSSSSSSPSS